MVYSNKFVLALLLNGQPQEELANGVVKLPFGAEYTLRFRNKNNRRAVVKFTIDGEEVSGNGYIVNANDFIDIKRHYDKDVGFKFVSLDSGEAIDFGKNGPNHDKTKGLIEAKFYLEKEVVKIAHIAQPRPPFQPYKRSMDGNLRRRESDQWFSSEAEAKYSCCSIPPTLPVLRGFESLQNSTPLKDGCTVEGNITGQSFYTVDFEAEPDYVQLKIFLQGFDVKEVVAKPKPKQAKVVEHKISDSEIIDLEVVDYELENELLRKKIAELKNEKLKKQLAELQG